MTALLAGATGLIGREIAAQWRGPGPLRLLVRRAMAPASPEHTVHVVDFAALPALPQADTAFCCLGTTLKVAGSQAAFRAVDFDAVLAFARAAKAAGVVSFAVVSSLGANAHSRNFYSRVKGEVEAALLPLGFTSLLIVRPSLLLGDRAALGQPARGGEGLVQALAQPLSPLIPQAWRPIQAATVARAMLQAAAAARPGKRIILSGELHQLGQPGP